MQTTLHHEICVPRTLHLSLDTTLYGEARSTTRKIAHKTTLFDLFALVP
jgi:hypothetical protein